jgi:putative membrane protein (TIGR04086 family)
MKANSKSKPETGKNKEYKKLLLKPLKGSLLALVFTVLALLIFALIVKQTNIMDGAISVVNQIIKVMGIVYAAFMGSRGIEKKAFIAGGLSGLFYITMCYFLFSILEGSMGNFALYISDALMSIIIGIIVAVIFSKINLNKTKKQEV